MGKPRALKNKDVVPSVKIDLSTRSKKRINFDDVPDAEDQINSVVEEIKAPQDDEEEPEEVKADSYEILRLKEQLESTTTKRDRKRKRSRAAQDEKTSSADELLDVSILNSIETYGNDETENDASNGLQIEVIKEDKEVKLNKKYIGNFEIAVLEKEKINPVLNFALAKDVAEFNDKKASGVARVRYTTFMSQKRPTAAKAFRKVC